MKSKEEWIELLRDFNKSHLNMTQWCLENKLNRITFTKYRKLYNDEALAADGILNWASVEVDLESEDSNQIPIACEEEHVELNVKVFNFKLKKSTFKEELSFILQEVARI